jgi:hypothetical protein
MDHEAPSAFPLSPDRSVGPADTAGGVVPTLVHGAQPSPDVVSHIAGPGESRGRGHDTTTGPASGTALATLFGGRKDRPVQ